MSERISSHEAFPLGGRGAPRVGRHRRAGPVGGGSAHRTPPQVVANALTWALSADGLTVALLTSDGGPVRLRLYDFASGTLSAGADLPFTQDPLPYPVRWDASGRRLVVTVKQDEEGEAAVVRVPTVDPATGATRRTDQYQISARRHAVVTAGE